MTDPISTQNTTTKEQPFKRSRRIAADGYNEALVNSLLARGEDGRKAFGHTEEWSLQKMFNDGLGLYAFTTESIEDYLPLLDVAGKRCLTTAASGDQTIALLMAGAREVVAFDAVRAAGEVLSFKMQALVDHPWENRTDFVREVWGRALNPLEFAKISDKVQDPFYGGSYSMLQNAIRALPVGKADMVFKQFQVNGYTGYLADDETFERAKSACAKAIETSSVSFYGADIRDLPYMSLGEFDVIVLSNIVSANERRSLIRYPLGRDQTADARLTGDRGALMASALGSVQTKLWPVANMLAKGGKMQASYDYGCRPADDVPEDCEICEVPVGTCKCYVPSPFSDRKLRKQVFAAPPGFTVSEHEWQTVNSELGGVDVATIVTRL